MQSRRRQPICESQQTRYIYLNFHWELDLNSCVALTVVIRLIDSENKIKYMLWSHFFTIPPRLMSTWYITFRSITHVHMRRVHIVKKKLRKYDFENHKD